MIGTRLLFTLGALSFAAVCATAQPRTYLITTIAGGQPPATPAQGLSVGIGSPSAVAVDSAGTVYFPVPGSNVILRMNPDGMVVRVAGTGIAGYSGDGGSALSAQLSTPSGVAVDSAGNVYIADTNNRRVRRVAPDGTISTVAGNGTGGYSGDGSAAVNAQLNYTYGVAVDSSGNLYIADTYNQRIRKVSNGIITTVAGNGVAGFSGDNSAATAAQINFPQSLCLDNSGNLYITDTNNHRIRKVSGGTITTVAGNGVSGYSGDNIAATSAQLSFPDGVAIAPNGTLYIADTDDRRVRMVSNGVITTVAGNGNGGYSGDGGSATSATINQPYGVALDSSGNLYVADFDNERIRKVSGGIISTIVGGATGDGAAAPFAGLNQPFGVVKDPAGNIYVSDTTNNQIRKIAPSGVISTIAGTGVPGYTGDNGSAALAQLNGPSGLALDNAGNLYIADTYNNRVRKLSSGGTITTVAGSGTCCYSGDNGPAVSAELYEPQAVAVDASGNLYIADTLNNRIRKVSAGGTITTLAGTGVAGYSGDSGPATGAQLNHPQAVAVDSAGNVYIADTNNYRVRKVASGGTITTLAGTGVRGFSGDGGAPGAAQVNTVYGLALDSSNNLYLADWVRIREITGGTISTIAGSGGFGYSGDAGPALNASFENASGLVVDASGNIYVADQDNEAIRLLTPMNGGSPVLTVGVTHSGLFTPGSAGQFTVGIANATGASTVNGLVTVSEILPAGLTLASMTGGGWSCSGSTCTRSDALAGGSNYPPITVTVNVASSATAQVTNRVTVAGGGSAMAGAEDLAGLIAAALSISVTHSGNFVQGQSGAYTVTASNQAGFGPTSSVVTVTEDLPAGLTLTSMSGSGWTCPSGSTVCVRSDTLSPGASYPPITVNVSVAGNAPAQVTNQVTISGGGAPSASAGDPTNISVGVQHPAFFSGEASVGNGYYFLQFSDNVPFGYYTYLVNSWIFHSDLGYEFVYPANDAAHSVYLWDFAGGHWLFTNPANFPYLYDFNLHTWIYYFPNTSNAGHYTSGPRWFANLSTHQNFTM